MNDATTYAVGLLQGDRIRLRPLAENDLPILEQWWADPEWAVLQQAVVRPRPAGSMIETFQGWSANDDPAATGFCVSPLDGDELLGHVTLFGITAQQRSATFAIIMGPDSAGRGYGSDAIKTMTRYGFDELGLHRIGLQVWAFNERAIAAYRKAGYIEEGRRREVVFHAGRFHDEIQMGLLAREWRQDR